MILRVWLLFGLKDGDLINNWGELGTSREDIEKIFIENDKGLLKNATIAESVEYIHFIAPDVALLDVDRVITNMTDAQGKNIAPLTNHALYVFVKRKGQWQIIAFRGYDLKKVMP